MSSNMDLEQRIKEMNIKIILTHGHLVTFNEPNPYFKKCKDVLESLCENETLFSLFAPEVHEVLTKLEKIRKTYETYDERIARELTKKLEAEVAQTIQGIEIINRQYHGDNVQDTITSVENDIRSLEQTEKELSKQIRSISVQNEGLIKIIAQKGPKENLPAFFETLSGQIMHGKREINFASEYKNLLKKERLQTEHNDVESRLASLKQGLKILLSSSNKALEDKNARDFEPGSPPQSHF